MWLIVTFFIIIIFARDWSIQKLPCSHKELFWASCFVFVKMIITVFSKTHNFVFISIVVRLSDTAVSDSVQQLVVCFCGPRKWAVVWSWPDDWQVRLLTRVLETWGNVWPEVSAVGRTKRVEGSNSETQPLMWRRGRRNLLSIQFHNSNRRMEEQKRYTSISQSCCYCSSFCMFCLLLLWPFQVLNNLNFQNQKHIGSYTATRPGDSLSQASFQTSLDHEGKTSSLPLQLHSEKKLLCVYWISKAAGWRPHYGG